MKRVLIEDTFRRDNEYANVASRVLVDEPMAARLASRSLCIDLPFMLSAKAAAKSRAGNGAAVSARGPAGDQQGEARSIDLQETRTAIDGPEHVIEIEDDAEDMLDQVTVHLSLLHGQRFPRFAASTHCCQLSFLDAYHEEGWQDLPGLQLLHLPAFIQGEKFYPAGRPTHVNLGGLLIVHATLWTLQLASRFINHTLLCLEGERSSASCSQV